ncbi:MAG TPA: YkvA family protein, partial [Gammaproteobacteria bacterium]|nr:YkvA family protein [Gammaproteobacteria bacterium]
NIPFAEDLAAAYYCAADPATPTKVKGVLFAALAYFVMPFDAVPDFIAGLGFTDDAAVLAMAIGLVSRHITNEHRKRARRTLGVAEPNA